MCSSEKFVPYGNGDEKHTEKLCTITNNDSK